MTTNNVGRYARSVESGWLGRIEAVEDHDGDVFYRMKGVNEICRIIAGGDIADWIDDDDTQWFAPEDVTLIKEKVA